MPKAARHRWNLASEAFSYGWALRRYGRGPASISRFVVRAAASLLEFRRCLQKCRRDVKKCLVSTTNVSVCSPAHHQVQGNFSWTLAILSSWSITAPLIFTHFHIFPSSISLILSSRSLVPLASPRSTWSPVKSLLTLNPKLFFFSPLFFPLSIWPLDCQTEKPSVGRGARNSCTDRGFLRLGCWPPRWRRSSWCRWWTIVQTRDTLTPAFSRLFLPPSALDSF